jgi:hypothetical protein
VEKWPPPPAGVGLRASERPAPGGLRFGTQGLQLHHSALSVH